MSKDRELLYFTRSHASETKTSSFQAPENIVNQKGKN